MTAEQIWREYLDGVRFKEDIGLFETVRANENFFVGKQWEGVQAGGLPTPVFNFIRRIVLFLVATTATDNAKLTANPMAPGTAAEEVCQAVNHKFAKIFEDNKMGLRIRELVRAAAVDGDGCIYTYYDPDYLCRTGKGGIRAELVENSRVFFGNPARHEVEDQPYILLARRELVTRLRERAEEFGGNVAAILPDSGETDREPESQKATVVLRFWRDRDTGTVWCAEATRDGLVRPPWNTEQRRYPLVWLSWDTVPDCYHGQAAVTGLIPNQIFVNKLFAMSMISLMTTAYPKIVYDKTRIPKWDSRVGTAIGVTGGDMSTVARTIDPAAISPQVPQFIQLAISLTKEFMGATDAALGTVKPDNTSAILALQKASGVPMELIRQNLYQRLEDLGLIWLDLMRVYFGKEDGMDYAALETGMMSVQLDVGASAYWSELAQLTTLDHLLTSGQITLLEYLERVPNGYITDQNGLMERARKEEKEETA